MEEWLRSVGLSKYTAVFRENGITFDQLGDLTEQDMLELGLTIGDRKRFKRAVRQRQTPSIEALSTNTLTHTTNHVERRPLTVMFVDLVNSTALGEQLDAEDMREVIRCYPHASPHFSPECVA